jgi:hypothetical protein
MSQLRTNSIVPVGGIPAGASGGGIIQCVQTTVTSVLSITSTTFTDLGMSVTITPRSTSNKILILMDLHASNSGADDSLFKLVRGATDIYIGDAASNRPRVTGGSGFTSNTIQSVVAHFIDSPATTSSTTYKIQTQSFSGTVYVNRTGLDSDNAVYGRFASSLIAMEVSG